MDLSTYNNDWYHPGPKFRRALWYIVNELFFKSALFPFYGLKRFLLRSFGASLGKNVLIKPGVNIKYPWFLNIGNNVWIGEKVWIDNLGSVTIGNNVCISQGALLLSGNHNYSKVSFDLIIKSIDIMNGVWIGANAIVFGGVTCHENAVLSLGSVATSNLDANQIYRGNPAQIILERKIL